MPAVYINAKANLADSLPKPYIDMTILIVKGGVGFLSGELGVALKDVKNDTLMAAFKAANAAAIAAAMRAGKDVVVDKPFTVTLAEARSLAEKHGMRTPKQYTPWLGK